MNKARLSDMTKIVSGQAAPKDKYFGSDGLPFIRAGNLESLINGCSELDLPKVNRINSNKLKLKLIPSNTILFAKSGMSATKNRVYKTNNPSYIVSHLAGILPSEKYFQDYLAWYFKWYGPSKMILDDAYPSIRLADIEKLEIPLPPLETQKKIATILDKADELRQNDKKILEKYDRLAQSVFLEMFGDQRTDFRGFVKIQLKDIIIDGPQNGLYKPSNSYGKGTPIIRIDAFNNSIVNISNLKRVDLDKEEINSYEIKEGEFLINRVNSMSHLGKCGLVPEVNERTVFESNMMRLRFNLETVTNTYMLYILSSRYIKNQILKCSKNAVNQSSINQTDVNSFVIPLPPIELQNKFGIVIKNLNLQKLFTNESIKRSEELFQNLLQRAFRGELW